MAWEPDRRFNFFFNPPAYLCAVTYMTEISLIVTLNNHIHSLIHSDIPQRGPLWLCQFSSYDVIRRRRQYGEKMIEINVVYCFFVVDFVHFASRSKIINHHVAGGTREFNSIIVSKICKIHKWKASSWIANLGHSDGIPSSLPQRGDRFLLFSHMRLHKPTGSLVLDRSIWDSNLEGGIHALPFKSKQSNATLIVDIVILRLWP